MWRITPREQGEKQEGQLRVQMRGGFGLGSGDSGGGAERSPGMYFKFPDRGVKSDTYIEGWRIMEDGFTSY